MGVSANGHCYGTAVEAAQVECASYPRTVATADGVVSWACSGAAADGSSLALVRHGSDGSLTASTVAVSYPDCDENEGYQDALTLWGLGLTAVVTVFVVKAFVYRLVANQ